MNDGPARRFHAATVAVAKALSAPDATPKLLLRLGLPGLMQRLGLQERTAEHESLLRMQQLSQKLLVEAAHRISASLTTASVPHFFAKGIALIDVVYRPGDRAMGDYLDGPCAAPQRLSTRAGAEAPGELLSFLLRQ